MQIEVLARLHFDARLLLKQYISYIQSNFILLRLHKYVRNAVFFVVFVIFEVVVKQQVIQ